MSMYSQTIIIDTNIFLHFYCRLYYYAYVDITIKDTSIGSPGATLQ